ncbi:MAG: alpha/beta fold hydrolase, partial [Paracoccaceae bacterium]
LSMGAMVAMEVMSAAPQRIASACLMATDPGAARQQEIDWRAGLWAEGFDIYLDTFTARFYGHDPKTAARLQPMTREKMGETPEQIARAQAHALDTRRDMLPLLANCQVRTRILVGAQDKICPPKLHQPLADILPNSHMTEVPDCGHILSLEQPELTVSVLRNLVLT